ncbi:MAG: Transcriptional regulator, AraC family [Labilithrix sp.]|nr:Transcriptional regulator, AraC family [Labilithrix sp.]
MSRGDGANEAAARRRGGRPPREAASPSALAPALLRWLAGRGADATLLADRGGLERSDIERDEAPATATGLAAMLGLASELVAEPHLALRLPAELPFRRYDAGALAARVAATPRDVLAAIARFAALIFPRLEAELVEGDGEVLLYTRIGGAPRGLGHHVDEYVLAFVVGHCRRGGVALAPRRVWLASARPPGDLRPLMRALGTDEIELGASSTGLAFATSDASVALPSFDPMLVAAAEQLASAALASAPRAGAVASTVTAKIAALLPGAVSAETIAAAMRMSARTLQRRLEDEGARFSDLVDGVRERKAKELLAGTLPLAEVGYRLGFSDLAAFARAFKRWTGVPPGAFRRMPR